jgi:hypothetical protein
MNKNYVWNLLILAVSKFTSFQIDNIVPKYFYV